VVQLFTFKRLVAETVVPSGPAPENTTVSYLAARVIFIVHAVVLVKLIPLLRVAETAPLGSV